MAQLQPTEKFTLFRGIEDPADTGTYYVQAVIRNALTRVVLDTIQLTDNLDHTFSKEWDVPADVSGAGFYITIQYSVYIDSGYTTKSDVYGEKFEEHLVQTRYNFNLGGGGGGVDYKKIRQIIKEEIDKIEKQDIPAVDLTDIKQSIADLKQSIDIIDIPQPRETDLSPVLKAVNDIRIPEQIKPDKVDLSGVVASIDNSGDKIEKITLFLNSLKTELNKLFTLENKNIDEIKKDILKFLENMPLVKFDMPLNKQDTIKKRIY